jgi:hypothetical protein
VLTTYSCNKEQEAPPLSPDEIVRQEITAKLEQDAYPMNLLSREAKDELVQNVVIEDGIIRSFNKQDIINQELDDHQRTDLHEVLLERGVRLYKQGVLVYESPLAKKSHLTVGEDPIAEHYDYGWVNSNIQCCKMRDASCIGEIRNPRCVIQPPA